MKRLFPIFPFVFIAGALVGALWPLLRPGFYLSDDGEWMVIRLTAFYQSLADGQFPVRFLGRLNNSYGYPVANFLYPGFLYLGSLLHVFGFSFVSSVKLILVAGVVGSTAAMWATLRRLFSPFAATLGVVAYVGSPYLLYDLYTRGSVGEILAFWPGSVGIYSIITDKPSLFAIAVAGLVVSHNTLAALFLIVYAVFIVTHNRRSLFPHLLIGLGMSAFFWMPAMIEKRYVRFDLVAVSNPMEYVLRPSSLWLAGGAGIIAAVVLVTGGAGKRRKTIGTALVLFLGSILLALPLSGFLWSIRPIASLVQFPYRLLSVASITAPFLVAGAAEKFSNRKIATVSLLLVLLFPPAWYQLRNIVFVRRDEGYYTTNEATTTVADEYLPRWVIRSRPQRAFDRLVFEKGRGSIVYEHLNTQRVVASIDALEESVLRFHTIYYPGWGITLDGIPVPVTYKNPHGFMEVAVPAGTHKIEAEFRETVLRFLADILSTGSFIVWGVRVWKRGVVS